MPELVAELVGECGDEQAEERGRTHECGGDGDEHRADHEDERHGAPVVDAEAHSGLPAEREDVDRTAVALAFVLAHPSAPVAIIGSQNPERIAGSVSALAVQLDRHDVYQIVQASEGVPLP